AMLCAEYALLVLLRELAARVKEQAEIGSMRDPLDDREHRVLRRFAVLVLGGSDMAAAIPWEAEILTLLGDVIVLYPRHAGTQTTTLTVIVPQLAFARQKIHPHRIAQAIGIDPSIASLPTHSNDSADPVPLEGLHLPRRRNVERLAELDIKPVVRPIHAYPGG